MKKVFAFVFARGGSKGLPRKNVLPFGGKPLIAHSIDVAKQVKGVERIFVSTDDDEIKRIAKEFGAEVIDRPEELASDKAPELEAWRHAITYLKEKGEHFDIFLSLPATSPLRHQSDISACMEALDNETDVVITVTPAARSPYFNMVSRDLEGYSSILIPSNTYARRQDAPQVYDMTTVAYVIRPDFFIEYDALFEGRVKSVVIPKERAIDIDDMYDFKFAEVILQGLK